MSLVRFRPKAPFAGLAHLVERHLAKVEVASSSLVTRSIWRHSQVVRQRSAKPLFPSSNLGVASKDRFRLESVFFLYLKITDLFCKISFKANRKNYITKEFSGSCKKKYQPENRKNIVQKTVFDRNRHCF